MRVTPIEAECTARQNTQTSTVNSATTAAEQHRAIESISSVCVYLFAYFAYGLLVVSSPDDSLLIVRLSQWTAPNMCDYRKQDKIWTKSKARRKPKVKWLKITSRGGFSSYFSFFIRNKLCHNSWMNHLRISFLWFSISVSCQMCVCVFARSTLSLWSTSDTHKPLKLMVIQFELCGCLIWSGVRAHLCSAHMSLECRGHSRWNAEKPNQFQSNGVHKSYDFHVQTIKLTISVRE